ncbi:MAG TPA: DNA repair protein RadC [Kiritimatiellia bacterium]|nr:DNA repair protein RadC [Kiritimatiellia bacterium]
MATYEISARRIQDLPMAERPRELMDELGAEQVNDRVLLSIVLRSGIRGKSVVDVAEDLLLRYGTLQEMSRVSVDELAGVSGVGKVRAQVVKAALELGRRMIRNPVQTAPDVRTPEAAAQVIRERTMGRDTESFWVLLLDTKYRLRRPPQEIGKGTLDACLVHPRDVFKEAIRSCSAAIVMVHNHPSGDPTPSAEDLRITRQLIEAGKIVDIQVLDHIIMGQRTEDRSVDFISLRESGLVGF